MDKLSQHLNFRDTDQHLWHTIDAGDEILAEPHDAIADDLSVSSKHMPFYNAEIFEGMQRTI